MAKGFSIRRTVNYYKGLDGKWKGHSMAVWDNMGYTRQWASIEDAMAFIEKEKANRTHPNPDEEYYIRYWRIYKGKECLMQIE